MEFLEIPVDRKMSPSLLYAKVSFCFPRTGNLKFLLHSKYITILYTATE